MNFGRKGDRNNVKPKADIKETILEVQYDNCTYELTVFVTTGTRLVQVKS